ncbi:MAG TPA: hypothetical protein DCQ90_06585 [Erysipelotrichaceae bacterium]|nr:hypothetical protein [Erysipelotrichaceae bacterium]
MLPNWYFKGCKGKIIVYYGIKDCYQIGYMTRGASKGDYNMADFEKPTVEMIRVGLKLTQSQMAEKLGISVKVYRARELGRKEFEADHIAKILSLSGLKFDQVRFTP